MSNTTIETILSMPIGTRVRLVHDVERYPHFIADAGMEGTLVYRDDHVICIKMDEHLDGAEEWDNQIQWSIEDDWMGIDQDIELIEAAS